MKRFDYPQLPEKLQKGLNDYCKFWEQGLKKRANEVIRECMKYYDTLSEDVHKEFISIVCAEICDNHTELFRDYSLPYEVSIRLARELFPYVDQGVLPQARWHCELFGDLEETISVYRKNKDDFKTAGILMSRLVYLLSFGAHHFPEYSCLENVSELDRAQELGGEILKNHNIDAGFQQEFQYYVKLHRLFYSWDGEGDFALLCRRNGLEFNEIAAYYYK
ncbi:hypothetical protein AALA98_17400 [Lachnospiraceae bacterium 45-W7]